MACPFAFEDAQLTLPANGPDSARKNCAGAGLANRPVRFCIVTHHRLIMLGILLGSALASAPCLGQTAPYAPIVCAKASTATETTICGNYELGRQEARLATLYGILTSLVAMGQRGDIIDAQLRWIAVRNACGSDVQCLVRAYQTRIGTLSQQFDALAKRGPF